MSNFPNKYPDEEVTLTFDFTALVASLTNPVMTVVTVAGTDSNPATILQGVPTVDGTKVLQVVSGGNNGCIYSVQCQIKAPDGSYFTLDGYLPVFDVVPAPGNLTTLDSLKQWLSIAAGTDDALLANMIISVSVYIQNWLNRTINQTIYTDTYNGLGQQVQVLKNYPVISVSSVSISGVMIPPRSNLANVNYPDFAGSAWGWVNDDSSVYLSGGCLIRGFQNIQISYSAGYASVPYDIMEAANDICGDWYKYLQRIGKTSQSIESQTTVFVNQPMPTRAANMLQQYKRTAPL